MEYATARVKSWGEKKARCDNRDDDSRSLQKYTIAVGYMTGARAQMQVYVEVQQCCRALQMQIVFPPTGLVGSHGRTARPEQVVQTWLTSSFWNCNVYNSQMYSSWESRTCSPRAARREGTPWTPDVPANSPICMDPRILPDLRSGLCNGPNPHTSSRPSVRVRNHRNATPFVLRFPRSNPVADQSRVPPGLFGSSGRTGIRE